MTDLGAIFDEDEVTHVVVTVDAAAVPVLGGRRMRWNRRPRPTC